MIKTKSKEMQNERLHNMMDRYQQHQQNQINNNPFQRQQLPSQNQASSAALQHQPPASASLPTSCAAHSKPLELICITCRSKICHNCALFGEHKGHDIREEDEAMKEVIVRTEVLMEMFE